MKKNFKKYFVLTFISIVVLCLIIYIINCNKNTNVLQSNKIVDKEKKNVEKIEDELKIEVKRAKVPALMYHSITDDMAYIEYSINAVSPKDFENQLKYISDNGYQTIFFNNLDDLGKFNKPILLTFDDGFIDFYNEAFPLLKKYNQKATLFVIVGYISCENYCTVEQLIEMESSGLVDVQLHTQSHKNLTSIFNKELEEEVVKSKNILQDYLEKEVNVICYPYGAYNKTISDLVSKYYLYAVTMNEGCYDTNLHNDKEIPRYTIPRGLSINQFINYISNSYVEIKN